MTRRILWFLGVAMLAISGCQLGLKVESKPVEKIDCSAVSALANKASKDGAYFNALVLNKTIITGLLGRTQEDCRVIYELTSSETTTRVSFDAPTCDQAAQKVLERLAKP